jgi:5'-nucleotidase
MRILLVNDDGIDAPGIRALYQAIADLGEVHVVAPAKVQSAKSHAVTFHRAIAVESRTISRGEDQGDFEGLAVHGTPADCVKLAARHLVPGPIDLVLSGINAGANIGVNVLYSGTVAAAAEAAIMGLPAVAVSLHIGRYEATRWDMAGVAARRVLDQLLAVGLQPGVVMNVNLPILDEGQPPTGLRVVPASCVPLADEYDRQTDEGNGRVSFAASGGLRFAHACRETDVHMLFDRHVTVTPLRFDVNCQPSLAAWRQRLEP